MRGGRAVPVVVVAALVASCSGGSKQVEARAWARDVCGELTSWFDGMDSMGADLEAVKARAGDDAAAARADVVRSLDGMVERTDRLVNGIEDAGTPDVAQGGQISGDVQQGVTQLRDAFADARDKAEDLPVSTPSAFEEGLTTIGNELNAAADRIGGELDRLGATYDAPALENAFQEVPECREGAGEPVPADRWSEEVCGQLVSWQSEIGSLVGGLQSQVQGERDMPAGRARFVEFMNGVVKSTDELLASIEAAGVPNTEQGQDIAGNLEAGLREMRSAFERGRATAANVAVDDPAAFTAGLEQINVETRSALDRMKDGLRQFGQTAGRDPAFSQAFQHAPACQQLAS